MNCLVTVFKLNKMKKNDKKRLDIFKIKERTPAASNKQ